MMMGKPPHSSPMRLNSGTRTFCSSTSAVVEARTPSFPSCLLVVSPSEPRSTTKQVMPLWPKPGSIVAITSRCVATSPQVMKVLAPLRTYPSPLRSAFV